MAVGDERIDQQGYRDAQAERDRAERGTSSGIFALFRELAVTVPDKQVYEPLHGCVNQFGHHHDTDAHDHDAPADQVQSDDKTQGYQPDCYIGEQLEKALLVNRVMPAFRGVVKRFENR